MCDLHVVMNWVDSCMVQVEEHERRDECIGSSFDDSLHDVKVRPGALQGNHQFFAFLGTGSLK